MNEEAEHRRTTDASEVIMVPRRTGPTLFFSAEAKEQFQREGRWWSADPASARQAATRPGDPIIFDLPSAAESSTSAPAPAERPRPVVNGEASEPTAIRATLTWCAAYGWEASEYSPTDAADAWVEAAEALGLDAEIVEGEWVDDPVAAVVRVAGRLYLLLVGATRLDGSREVTAEPFTPIGSPGAGAEWHGGAEQPQLIIGRPGMGKTSMSAWLAAETIARGGAVFPGSAAEIAEG